MDVLNEVFPYNTPYNFFNLIVPINNYFNAFELNFSRHNKIDNFLTVIISV